MVERIKIVVNISGTIRRYSFLLVVLTFCIGIKDACPSTTQSDLLKKVNPALTSEELEELYQYKLDHGIKNLSILSAFLIRSSKKYLKEGRISKEDAGKVAAKVKSKHPVFKSITVIDAGKRWDYRYRASPEGTKKGEEKDFVSLRNKIFRATRQAEKYASEIAGSVYKQEALLMHMVSEIREADTGKGRETNAT